MAVSGNELHVRFDSDADDGKIAGDPPTALREDMLDALGTFERDHRILEDHLDAVFAMNSSHDAADFFAQHAKERRAVRIDDDHVNLFLTQGCDNFGADKPHSDDRRPAPRCDISAKSIRIADSPQIVDALEIEAWQREPAILPAGRNEELLVSNAAGGFQFDDPVGWNHSRRTGAQERLNPVLLVECRRPHQHALE